MTEQERYRKAWRDRNIRFAVFLGGFVGFPFVFSLTLGWFVSANYPLFFRKNMHLLIDLYALFYFLFVVVLVTWWYRFRCPRCGEIFLWKSWTSLMKWPTACLHCRLPRNAIPYDH
jgi:membrane protease YdiL (CAAX protease family)